LIDSKLGITGFAALPILIPKRRAASMMTDRAGE